MEFFTQDHIEKVIESPGELVTVSDTSGGHVLHCVKTDDTHRLTITCISGGMSHTIGIVWNGDKFPIELWHAKANLKMFQLLAEKYSIFTVKVS